MCSSSADSGRRATAPSACARPKPTPEQAPRLQKYLAAAGIGSRRHCEALIADGAVAVDGRVVTEQGTRVDPDRQRVTVRGRPVRIESKLYWMLHKPAGCVTTCRDPQGRRTFLDFLPRLPARLYPVGRLDYDSEGLLLATNDGDLALRLTHPRHGIEKTYRVRLDRPLDAAALGRLAEGVVVGGTRMRMAGIAPERGAPGGEARYEIRLREGRNRQIRRMLETEGRRVRRLRRVRLGPLVLGDLPPGAARPLTPREIDALRRAAGLDSAAFAAP